MKLKKLFAVLMTAVLVVGMFTACGGNSEEASSGGDGVSFTIVNYPLSKANGLPASSTS